MKSQGNDAETDKRWWKNEIDKVTKQNEEIQLFYLYKWNELNRLLLLLLQMLEYYRKCWKYIII